ncbi:MAG: glycosyltransferase family 4 protein [Planctomycetota bacterium]
MKVLFIHDKFLQATVCASAGVRLQAPNAGGLPVYLQSVIGTLQARGCSVAGIRFTTAVQAPVQTAPGFYEMPAARFLPKIATLRHFWRIIEREHPDLVHLHSAFYAMHPLLLRSLRRSLPVIATFHDVGPLCFWHTKVLPDGSLCSFPVGPSCLRRGCYRLGARESAVPDLLRVLSSHIYLNGYRSLPAIIVPSGYLREVLLANGFAAGRVQVVPLFSRYLRAGGELGQASGPARGEGSILFVGRLVRQKGLTDFLEALSRLGSRTWLARVVGEGEMLEEGRRAVERDRLGARVVFAGRASSTELAGHYQWSRFLVMPSLVPESFGLVGVESLSFGKPVVAYHAGGVTEWLQDGVTGFLVRRGEVGELAGRIARLLADEPLRERLGENGRRLVESRFTLEGHVNRLLEIYAGVLAGAQGSIA